MAKNYRGRRRFGRRRRGGKKQLKYSKSGTIFKYENGGTHNAVDAVYIGHGVATERVLLAFWHAMVRKLFAEYGLYFSNYYDVPNFTDEKMVIYGRFYAASDNPGVASPISYVIQNTDTYHDIAVGLLASMRTQVTSNVPINLQTLEMSLADPAGGDTAFELHTRARLNCDNLFIMMDIWSEMKIQNVTTSNSDGATAHTTSVDVNPLVGNHYRSRKWTNNVIPKGRLWSDSGTGFDGFKADVDTGLMLTDEVGLETVLKKPPPGWVFGCKQNRVVMHPGNIHNSKFHFTCRMHVNTLLEKLANAVNSASNNYDVEFGRLWFWGLEKMLDSRTHSEDIKIHYQLDQTYSARIEAHQASAPPITIVQAQEMEEG